MYMYFILIHTYIYIYEGSSCPILSFHSLLDSLIVHADLTYYVLKLLSDLKNILKILGQIYCCKSAVIKVISDLVYAWKSAV
jgi:hypothetical protein